MLADFVDERYILTDQDNDVYAQRVILVTSKHLP